MKASRIVDFFRRHGKTMVLVVTGLSVAAGVTLISASGDEQFVTGTPSITQRFSGVRTEKMVLDFCYQLQTIHGITGISYRDFSATDQSVMITVFYDPQMASPRQLKVFLLNSGILWTETKST